MNLTKNDGA
jgi:hypothetical protein